MTKGIEGGICNRSSCNYGNALFYNRGTHKYYCFRCASKINNLNQDINPPLFNKEDLEEYISNKIKGSK